jgi:glycine/D-amino acid oxidase-like deaminating enzyme/nitrite reductase/ring-hydroxylating ferredoxin subunit
MEKINFKGKATSVWMDTTPKTNYASLSGDMETDVAVVGGGIAGLMIAFFLKNAGFKVIVLEGSRIASGTTGFTTAKVTSAHGMIYKYLIDKFGENGAKIYADANEAARAKIVELIKDLRIDCDYKKVPAYTYVLTRDGDIMVEEEVAAAKSLGLPASFTREIPLPYPISSAVKFDNQAQFHPRKFLLKIASLVNSDGNYIFEETSVLDIKEGKSNQVVTNKGTVTAKKVVIATNFPIYDPAGFFANMTSRQSFTIGSELAEKLPVGVFYGPENNNFHSLRTQQIDENHEILIVGGELVHPGENIDSNKKYELLEKWTRNRFPVKSVKYHWTTSDSESYDRVPIIGQIAPNSKNIFVATGFSGWGMTHSTVAGMILADELRGKSHPWSKLYSPKRFDSFSKNKIKNNSKENKMIDLGKSVDNLKNGGGKVITLKGKEVAVYKDESGNIHALSAICTHMGCTVGWNDKDKTWDCPCHGSRYSAEGKVIHGPTVKNLNKISE